ncbi:hypothetical protein TI39_contig596g00005 [Zymoseptoria brevis]|uniref:Uncharacterized protein n=1 Tax=Zymoseptoria brevis TaxID=1047168 RepID=A0A0F4GHK2_9PEZI|nr:hypothetical protein TI39_contig596g00005 [Zymoseptoria brevis]
MANGIPIKGSIYIYAPNKGAPVFFAVAFALRSHSTPINASEHISVANHLRLLLTEIRAVTKHGK